MKKNEILSHCIDILYEQLLMAQIEIQAMEKFFENHGESESAELELLEHRAKSKRTIEYLARKVEVAQKMLKEYEKQ